MKRGGSRMGYAEQFNLLSPCYKDGEQPAGFHMGGVKATATKKGKPTKKATKDKSSTTKKVTKAKSSMTKKAKLSKQKGGSSCYASPSVSEMGVHDRPASLEPSASELAWDNRMKGGGLNEVNSKLPNILTISTNNSSKSMNVSNSANNKINNISTYLNKLKGVVFDGNTQNGFAIVVERTTEDLSNSKNDRYSIKVIEQLNNTPTMSVLSDQTYSVISQTVRDTSSKVFPLKKTNNKPPVSMNVSTNTSNLNKKIVPQSVNYSISNANANANANPKVSNKNATANMFS
jgi:hypothetical protein